MSKQRNDKKSSGQHYKGDHDSFFNETETKTSAATTKGYLFKSPEMRNMYRKIIIRFFFIL